MAVDLVTVNPGDTLRFWTWYSIESGYDYAYVQLSTDGGATFVNLPGNITTDTNPNGNNLGNGITGNSSTWRQGIFPLDNYVGQSVLLGLRYRTDQGTLNEGFYVDEFYPVEAFQQDTVIATGLTDTLFWITGRLEGQYYYQVRACDAQNQWSGFSNRQPAIVHPQVGVDEPVLPQVLSLAQNYPNPFNPTTTIAFSVPTKAHVELSVYNIMGAKVATLQNGDMEAGSHRVNFDSGNIAAGVYFYRLKADGQTLTRKMILMK